jgi:hypothetical protein
MVWTWTGLVMDWAQHDQGWILLQLDIGWAGHDMAMGCADHGVTLLFVGLAIGWL